MITCQKRGCTNAATHAIQIGVPGLLDPDEAPPRATILMGVVVCEPCLDEETAEKWFETNGDTLRPLFNIHMAGGTTPPDFERAVVLGVPLRSPEYQNLLLQGLNQAKAN